MNNENVSSTTKAELASEDYLKRPYTRLVIPDSETSTFTARILEFPGCVAEGNTVAEAYERLEQAALSWINAASNLGQEIPSPASEYEYGGKVALRMPKSLHRQAAVTAQLDGTSLNQFIVAAVSERLGASNTFKDIAERFEHASIREQPNGTNEDSVGQVRVLLRKRRSHRDAAQGPSNKAREALKVRNVK